MQQSKHQLSPLDTLNLQNQPKMVCQLEGKKEIILSTNISKYNSDGKCQQRILVVTNDAILNILKTQNIIKSFMKKFMNFQNKYQIKRRIPITSLYGITITPIRTSGMFVIHVVNEHDYHYCAQNNKMLILKVICEEFKKITKKSLPFFFRDELIIANYCMSKSQLKDKKQIKPKDNPIFLDNEYFQEKKFQDEQYICQYSSNNLKVLPKNFQRIQFKKIEQGQKYYILKEQSNRSIRLQKMGQSKMHLYPQFSFYSDKKQLLFIPFQIGGCLNNYLSNKTPLSKQDLLFYLSQIILFLQHLHKEDSQYANLHLSNLFVKQNGYLILKGLDRPIECDVSGKKDYKISGDPRYFAPQVITCTGYGLEIDIWKLGICGYFLSTADFPFKGNSLKQLYTNILTKSVQKADVPQVVLKMLEKDKERRISLKQLKEHADFASVDWQSIEKEKAKPPHMPNINFWNGKIPVIYRLRKKPQDKQ